jgi:hypothetical protein
MASMARPAGADADGRSLQELAVDVITDIHKLATGLAHAGAPPKVTSEIESSSALFGGIAKALAAGPVGAQVPNGGPGGPAPAPQAATAPPAGPPPPSPGAAIPGPGTPQSQSPAQGDLHNTIAQMHKDSVNAVARSR